jgi:hypothetical protein
VYNDGEVYSADCIDSFGYRDVGSLTEYTIESGAKVSDHYVLENKEVSLGFVITDIKAQGSTNPRSTDEFIYGITKLRESKKPFKLYWREASGKLERFFDNLMFTEVSFNQDPSFGYAGNGIYAYKGSFSMKQIQYASRAIVSEQYVPKLKGSASKEKTANVSTKKINTLPGWLRPTSQQPTISSDPNLSMLKSQVGRMKRGEGQ